MAPITVRVVEYHLLDPEGNPTETFVLITNLRDPRPPRPRNWPSCTTTVGGSRTRSARSKSGLKAAGVVLRWKSPDGAEQELWALLCVYHAIREFMCTGAELAEHDPLRSSIVVALDAVRGPVGDPTAIPP